MRVSHGASGAASLGEGVRGGKKAGVNPWRVLAKALVLFAAFNLTFAALSPPVQRLSTYNWLVKGRERFPYGGKLLSYNLVVGGIDANFGAHAISGTPKGSDEYRVVILGDSQTWGTLQTAKETLSGQLNERKLSACGKRLRFYNLAYPFTSATKDFLILSHAMRYQPDLVVWPVTLRSFDPGSPLPMFSEGTTEAWQNLRRYGLEQFGAQVSEPRTFWERTFIGERTWLGELALLQLNGVPWQATGMDSAFPPPRALPVNMPANTAYRGYTESSFPPQGMAKKLFDATHRLVGKLPVLVVNEPIYMATGKNSQLRYSMLYPRWAYDRYRQFLPALVEDQGWGYQDLYDLIPPTQFKTTYLHIIPEAEATVAKTLVPDILRMACPEDAGG